MSWAGKQSVQAPSCVSHCNPDLSSFIELLLAAGRGLDRRRSRTNGDLRHPLFTLTGYARRPDSRKSAGSVVCPFVLRKPQRDTSGPLLSFWGPCRLPPAPPRMATSARALRSPALDHVACPRLSGVCLGRGVAHEGQFATRGAARAGVIKAFGRIVPGVKREIERAPVRGSQ